MRLIPLILAGSASLALVACGDNRTDDVVQITDDGTTAQPVTEEQAAASTSEAALALGMTRKALEDADIVTPNGVDLGDVDRLEIDGAGKVTHLIVELDGPGDVKVRLPIDQVSSYRAANSNDQDLQTNLTAAELAALPKVTVR